MSEPFKDPFASQIQVPGGIAGNLLFSYALNRANVAGLIDDPLYTGGHNAFDVFRGTRYDHRQMTALQAAADAQRAALSDSVQGAYSLAGHEFTTELRGAVGNMLDMGMPAMMEAMRRSPMARRAVSVASSGASPAIVGMGMEGITRRMMDPGTGMVGMSGTQSAAMAASVTNMLSAGPRYTTPREGKQGVMLSQGSNYGFSDIDTMFAMATMAREGSLPVSADFLAEVANPGLQAAFKDGTLNREAYALGGKLTRQQQMLIDDGRAQSSDFYDSTRTGVLSIMEDFGVTDPDSFDKFQTALRDPGSAQSVRVQEISASRVAEAAGARIANLQAVMEFLTDEEIVGLGEDLADVSSAMLKQMSGNAMHQISATKLEQNMRDMKFAADRLGLSREQVQAVAGMSAAAASQYGFQAADTDSFARSALTSMQQYNDLGMGDWARRGVSMYGADSKEEAVARSQRGLAGVRRSRNAKMVAALSILSGNAGVELTEGGAADRLLKEAMAGSYSEQSLELLRGSNEDIIDTLMASSTGISREDFQSRLDKQFGLAEEMANNPNIVAASLGAAKKDVFDTRIARSMANEMGRSLSANDKIAGAAGQEKLAASLSAAIASDLSKKDGSMMGDLSARGDTVTSQLKVFDETLRASAQAGNEAAQRTLLLSDEDREILARNTIAASYAAAQETAQQPLAAIVGTHGARGQGAATAAAGYSDAMGTLDTFAKGKNMKGAARTIAILKGATESGGSLVDFLQLAGLDVSGVSKKDLGHLRDAAMREAATIESQADELGGLDALDENHPLRARHTTFESAVSSIETFIAGEGKGTTSAEDEAKAKAFIKENKDALTGTGTGKKTAEKTAETTVPADERGILGWLVDELVPSDNLISPEGLERTGKIFGGSGSEAGTEAKISTATIDNVSMGPVTITLGNTVIQSDSATVASNRGSRSDVAGTA